MNSEKINTELFKAYGPLVEEYLNEQNKSSWMPPLFSKTSVDLRVTRKQKMWKGDRKLLVDTIVKQYQDCEITEKTDPALYDQIYRLTDPTTNTVTTGHQLCLFTGPLYFPIKILQTAKLAAQISNHATHSKVVPIFWMASEDHDFEEVNHAHVFGRTLTWDEKNGGAVGRMSVASMEPVLKELNEILGSGPHAQSLKDLLERAYASGRTLSQATRVLVHELFGKFGVVVLDADDFNLKQCFSQIMADELTTEKTFEKVTATNEILSEQYKIQVTPREINLFYMSAGRRERIEKNGAQYQLVDGSKKWSETEILEELKKAPDHFSPNVLMRPLYQEVILPNLAYIGGPGELAYWLQLKSTFETWALEFPGLMLRNSVMWLDGNAQKKMRKLELEIDDLFAPEHEVEKSVAKAAPWLEKLNEEKREMAQVYQRISELAEKIEGSLKPYVLGEGRKTEKMLENTISKLIKAQKDKNTNAIEAYKNLHQKLFPNGALHERYDNFVAYYLKHGPLFFETIYNEIDSFDERLCVISE